MIDLKKKNLKLKLDTLKIDQNIWIYEEKKDYTKDCTIKSKLLNKFLNELARHSTKFLDLNEHMSPYLLTLLLPWGTLEEGWTNFLKLFPNIEKYLKESSVLYFRTFEIHRIEKQKKKKEIDGLDKSQSLIGRPHIHILIILNENKKDSVEKKLNEFGLTFDMDWERVKVTTKKTKNKEYIQSKYDYLDQYQKAIYRTCQYIMKEYRIEGSEDGEKLFRNGFNSFKFHLYYFKKLIEFNPPYEFLGIAKPNLRVDSNEIEVSEIFRDSSIVGRLNTLINIFLEKTNQKFYWDENMKNWWLIKKKENYFFTVDVIEKDPANIRTLIINFYENFQSDFYDFIFQNKLMFIDRFYNREIRINEDFKVYEFQRVFEFKDGMMLYLEEDFNELKDRNLKLKIIPVEKFIDTKNYLTQHFLDINGKDFLNKKLGEQKLPIFMKWIKNPKVNIQENYDRITKFLYHLGKIIIKDSLLQNQGIFLFGKSNTGKTKVLSLILENFYGKDSIGEWNLSDRRFGLENALPKKVILLDDLQPNLNLNMLSDMKKKMGGREVVISKKYQTDKAYDITKKIFAITSNHGFEEIFNREEDKKPYYKRFTLRMELFNDMSEKDINELEKELKFIKFYSILMYWLNESNESNEQLLLSHPLDFVQEIRSLITYPAEPFRNMMNYPKIIRDILVLGSFSSVLNSKYVFKRKRIFRVFNTDFRQIFWKLWDSFIKWFR